MTNRIGICLLTLVANIALLMWALPASAQFLGVQYGPRAFSAAPEGTQALTLTFDKMDIGIGVNGSVLSSINNTANTTTLSYSRYFDLFGKTASLTAAVPFVNIRSELVTTCCGVIPGISESGVSDPYVQFNLPLIGGEIMSPKEFFTTEPGFSLTLHSGLRVPLGDYDPASPINSGANRYEFRVGLPMNYTWGTPTKQTTLEFVPVAYFYSDNDQAFGGGTMSQDTAYQFELHITHDFSPAFWGAINMMHLAGGETTTNGVADNNALNYTSSGVSVGGRLSKSLSYTISYGHRLSSKNASDDGNLAHIALSYIF